MPQPAVDLLDAIRRSTKPVSKAELVRQTTFSLATVTEHTDLLLRSELALSGSKGESTGGRKPKLLAFNADAGRIIAVDLESTKVCVALTDLRASILFSTPSIRIDVADGPIAVLDRIKELAFALMRENGVERHQVKGIGMGIPGPVTHSLSRPASLSIMPGWDRFPITDFWKQHLSCPCHIDNNVYTMALGEQTSEFMNDPVDLIFLKVGNGIGAGIVCEGRVYRGATETAGEVGHTNIGHDVMCYCGNRGCLEAVAGGRAIAARAEALAREGRSPQLATMLAEKGRLVLADVVQALEDMDPVAVELMRHSGEAIGTVLAGLVNFFNPSHIVIGGGVSQVNDVLLAAIRQVVYRRSLPIATRDLVIRHSPLGADAGIIGAAALTLDDAIHYAFSEKSEPSSQQAAGATSAAEKRKS